MEIHVNESDGTVKIKINPEVAAAKRPAYFGFGQTVKEFLLSRDGKRALVVTPDDSMVIDEKEFDVDLRELDDEQLTAVLDCDFFNPSEAELKDMIRGIRGLTGDHE